MPVTDDLELPIGRKLKGEAMPTDKNSDDYKAGWDAFVAGRALADKPGAYVMSTWDVGWHDAHADATRKLSSQITRTK